MLAVAQGETVIGPVGDPCFPRWAVDQLGAELAAIGITPDRATAVARSIIALLEGGFVFAQVERDADVLRDGGWRPER